MDETAVQIIRAEIRRHRALSTMANDMRLKVDHLTVAWALEDLLAAARTEKNEELDRRLYHEYDAGRSGSHPGVQLLLQLRRSHDGRGRGHDAETVEGGGGR